MTDRPPAADPPIEPSEQVKPDAGPLVRGRRPGPVWAATVILILVGAFLAFATSLLYLELDSDRSHGRSVEGVLWLVVALYELMAVAYVVLGVFIFRGANWARITAAVLAGINLVFALITIVASQSISGCLGLVLPIGLLALMFNRDVREWTA
jgi:hypothetical protein